MAIYLCYDDKIPINYCRHSRFDDLCLNGIDWRKLGRKCIQNNQLLLISFYAVATNRRSLPACTSVTSYMPLVPMTLQRIMMALTLKRAREIVMHQLRPVSKLKEIVFSRNVLILMAKLLNTVNRMLNKSLITRAMAAGMIKYLG